MHEEGATADPRAVGAEVERLLGWLGESAGADVASAAEELVRLLAGLYGGALGRIVEALNDDEHGAAVLDRLTRDDLVASLLVLHDLHPHRTEDRVRQALDEVRPYLGSHAGGVELLGVDDAGVVHLRLEGSCDGCPSSTVTVKLAIEKAIERAAPEVTGVEVAGVAEPAGRPLIPVESLTRRPADASPADVATDGPVWVDVPELTALAPGELAAVTVRAAPVVVCDIAGDLVAYRDACPACGTALSGGRLIAESLTCGSCARRYDVRHAGVGTDPGVHLEPLPLLVDSGVARIAVPPLVSVPA